MSKAETPVLMSPSNPEGWKLEELCAQMALEVETLKSPKIATDPRWQAKRVLRNNQQIVGLLKQAEALQRDSYDVLDAMKANEGPLGTPRIGAGSQ